MTTITDTRVRMFDDSLEQPLIPTNDRNESETPNLELDGRTDYHKQSPVLSDSSSTCWGQRLLNNWQFLNGFWLGFIIQTVSLGSTAMIAIYWGVSDGDLRMSRSSKTLYFVLVLLSQSWWLLFPAIYITIDGGLTRRNVERIMERYSIRIGYTDQNKVTSSSPPSQRDLYLGGIRFHVGIVVGCFFVWSMIDLWFGASPHEFKALFSSMLACLALCYGMVVIYDRVNVEPQLQEHTQRIIEEI